MKISCYNCGSNRHTAKHCKNPKIDYFIKLEWNRQKGEDLDFFVIIKNILKNSTSHESDYDINKKKRKYY